MTAKPPTIKYLTPCSLKVLNSSLNSGVANSIFLRVEVDQFKRRVDDRIGALSLPKLDVERAIHVLDVLAVTHHREIAVFTFNYNGFHTSNYTAPSPPNS